MLIANRREPGCLSAQVYSTDHMSGDPVADRRGYIAIGYLVSRQRLYPNIIRVNIRTRIALRPSRPRQWFWQTVNP